MEKNTKKLATMAMLVAVSVVLVYLIHTPIFPSAPFLEYDPADIPILIGTFMYGPVTGLVLTVLASAVQAFTVSAQNHIYGLVMHIIATGTLVLVAGNIYKTGRDTKHMVIGLIAGTLAMAAGMAGANHYITAFYYNMPSSVVDAMLVPVIIPFNLIKAAINSVVAFFAYKIVGRFPSSARA